MDVTDGVVWNVELIAVAIEQLGLLLLFLRGNDLAVTGKGG